MAGGSSSVESLVDHLFRHQFGQMVATLTKVFGPGRIDLAESVVQEALIKALQSWPFQGVPENPVGWLVRVAKNQALDELRRDQFLLGKEANLLLAFEPYEDEIGRGVESHLHPLLQDDQLRMMFVCAHPVLSREAQVALTLKTLCGLSVNEIARAFLSKVETIEQRLVRAKAKIRAAEIPFEVPAPIELRARVDAILDVIYLVFNEGYAATQGEELIRRDLCYEAIRLAKLLSSHPSVSGPKSHALLALMYFQASRFEARMDDAGELLLLSEQDRRKWDARLIGAGLWHLGNAAEGDELSDYHLQASIAACHATAADYESTNWVRIVSDYDELMLRHHTPIVALNRAVAIGMASGPDAALSELEKLKDLPPLRSYFLLPATFAEFHRRRGDFTEARAEYEKALRLVGTAPERRFLEKKLSECFP